MRLLEPLLELLAYLLAELAEVVALVLGRDDLIDRNQVVGVELRRDVLVLLDADALVLVGLG